MKALVTGAGGFLGLYVAEQLVARGDTVRAFCRGRYVGLDRLGVETVQGDIRSAEQVAAACAGVDVVFHTAAVAGIWGDWDYYYGINTLGTRNVLAGCRQYRIGRLVFTSSPSVTFDGGDQCGVDESTPYPKRWLCAYPRTKALAEQEVLAASGHDGLLTCALRPHLIWGPRDRHLIPRLLMRARQGRLRQVGDGTNLIDMIHAENAAAAHLLAADRLEPGSAIAGKAYFLSQGQPVNCWQWMNEILARAGLPPIKRRISVRGAYLVGAACEAVYRTLRLKSEPPMTRFLALQLGHSHYFNIERARRELGYVPRVSTADGMEQLARELRGQ